MKLVIDIPEEYYKTIKETKKEVVPIGWASIRDGIKYEERPQSQEDKKTKKCPVCGNDLYEYCFSCCYEGEKVT